MRTVAIMYTDAHGSAPRNDDFEEHFRIGASGDLIGIAHRRGNRLATFGAHFGRQR